MDLKKFMVPYDCTVSRLLQKITPYKIGSTRHLFACALIGAASLVAAPATAGIQPSSSLQHQCSKAPKLIVTGASTKAEIVKNPPVGAKSALRAGGILGLTHFDRDTYTSVTWQKHSDASGSCIRIKSITVEIGNEAPAVWLAPAVTRHACLKRVVTAHEMQHVSHHADYEKKLKSTLKSNLKLLLSGKTYSYLPNGKNEVSNKERLERNAKLAVAKLHGPIARAAQRRDQSIDTPEQYAIELAKCGM
ncbi:hypothetical protein [Donghicola mangrovi]|uniref:DUF922 domain-containing protein n=1 Tax=Donghicola mangrovi TaxID=2729614 RepID=A0A850PYX2_9RHOB|nr:hypothetical protein [Donghicola mangrovi]NVO22467.1 hypothetical protein [Donghicola mangrovi]